jgi:hypothetical protein
MIAYTLLVCLTLTGQAEDCRPFGNMRFRNKADCEHYRDHQAQRELRAQPRSDSNSAKKLVCGELNR